MKPFNGRMEVKFILLFLLSILQIHHLQAGPVDKPFSHPKVGERCPEFLLKEVAFFPKKQVRLNDFKGKWLVFDFWSSSCIACVQSFPRTNDLQSKFKSQVQVVLVGYDDNRIRTMYSKFREKEHLDLPCAYDTTMFNIYDIGSVPFVVIIDDKGYIRGITDELDTSSLTDLLSGKHPELPEASFRHEPASQFNIQSPFLVNGNGGNDSNFLYRSVLSKFEKGMPACYLNPTLSGCIKFLNNRGFQILGTNIGTLYRYAYYGCDGFRFGDSLYGKASNQVVLEIKDSSNFISDARTRKGLFCYSLSFPPSRSDPKLVMKMIQRDLLSYFGYSATIENRMVPYWKLVVVNDSMREKLKTKYNVVQYSGILHIGLVWKDAPIRNVLARIYLDHQHEVFIDETDIDSNVDINMSDCFFPDLNEVKKALKKNGLDLIRNEKEMKVIVIRNGVDQ